jgi:hypothetical protein
VGEIDMIVLRYNNDHVLQHLPAGTKEKHRRLQPGYLVSEPEFNLGLLEYEARMILT